MRVRRLANCHSPATRKALPDWVRTGRDDFDADEHGAIASGQAGTGRRDRSWTAGEMTDPLNSQPQPFRLTSVISSLKMGGAERTMAILTGAWAERGWDVVLLSLAGRTEEAFFELDGRVDVRHLDLYRPSYGVVRALASNFRRLRVIRAAIRASRPDVVLSMMPETNVLTIMASLGLRTPVVVEEQTDPSVHALRSPWGSLRRVTYPLAASVVAVTPSALAALGPARGRRGRVIPNPVKSPPPVAIQKHALQNRHGKSFREIVSLPFLAIE